MLSHSGFCVGSTKKIGWFLRGKNLGLFKNIHQYYTFSFTVFIEDISIRHIVPHSFFSGLYCASVIYPVS